ncbi:cellobiose transport system substrate-binding protein [Propionibacterium cyclohexanicum]|uniref:Cellobiose transport system substrate-binding protein n=1 Tax=Propionibacterium cyclohexanicum TaxID=64702 RepID=A0A1H9S455_9ACTN|nr:extracellular solute-binding protein [Propionibacterium cyclohexanicum]SER79777.1 cellobiose transport system substrate-binding protein [Propionibacterium cyclohexanicum]
MRIPRWRVAIAPACALLLIATGCSSNSGSGDATTGGSVNLTVATFNEFGYTDDLFAQFTKTHPNVKITQKKVAQSADAKTNLFTKLAAGSGLSDIEAVDGDWLPQVKQSADKFVNLSSDTTKDRWPDWVVSQATTTSGELLGDATDIGPEATCYRKDLFEKAGLPTDRDGVAQLLSGDWDHYFDVGKQFVSKVPGVGWYDSAGAVFNARVQQLANPFSSTKPTETVIPLDQNTQIKDLYNSTLTASVDNKLSAGLGQWSGDWQKAFQNGAFATMQCPAWMQPIIKTNASGVTSWDIANVFPGGAGNWGGSYLTVPKQGKHTKEAQELAEWLTSPDVQVQIFLSAGNFPASKAGAADSKVLAATNEFFNNAPTGKIFSARAAAVTTQPFKGPNYFTINTVLGEAIGRVDVDKSANAADSWNKAVADAKAQVK